MSRVIMIPARYASSRFPGKPLTALRGGDGVSKTLIQRSWEAAMAVSGVDAVYVATDDQRIADAAEGFGATALMTPESCRNGTERCAAALERLTDQAPDIVVNLQGDAPLTPPGFVEALIGALDADQSVDVATPALRCDPASRARFRADRAAGRVGATTLVRDRRGRALYFSKEVIPYTPSDQSESVGGVVYHHVGVYAYRPKALAAYMGWSPGMLEQAEGLEQLRFLENGMPIACVDVDAGGRSFWEVNNPEDVPVVEAALCAGAPG